MKLWKILIVVAGLAGIAGFFLPMVNYKGEGASSVSAFQIARGASGAEIVGSMKDVGETYEATKATTIKLDATVNTGIAALKGIIIGFFVPSLLLVALGLAGIFRGKFGRLGGIFALILGLISAAIWGIFFLGSSDSQAYALGLGLHMLLVAGLGGIIGGLGSIVKPDGDRWTGV